LYAHFLTPLDAPSALIPAPMSKTRTIQIREVRIKGRIIAFMIKVSSVRGKDCIRVTT